MEGKNLEFVYYNDTGREVNTHPATEAYGTKCDMSIIYPLEERTFILPENTCPWVNMCDYGEKQFLLEND